MPDPSPAGAPAPVPLVLLAGFLGAGKTSFLRDLLPHVTAAGLAPQVLVNDYRNAGVDAQTLQGLARAVLPISGTCVCCDSRDELLNTLATLTLPPRSVILLEANGTADTETLIELLSTDRQARRCTLPIQVGVADARRWQKRYWNNRMEWAQLRTANLLHLTRRDEVTEARCNEVRIALQLCSPRAAWTDVADLTARLVALVEGAGALPPRRFAARDWLGGATPEHAHHHFASLELPLPAELDQADLLAFLTALPPEVLRAKGVAVLRGPTPEAVLFQKVEGADPPVLMPLGEATTVERIAIFIGPRLPVDTIHQLAAVHLRGAAAARR